MEGDEILFETLKAHGCQVPEDVQTVKQFSAPILVNTILRLLRKWDKSREYPRVLANTRAQRVNQATKIVVAMKELGYKGEDLSYHHLLFPNELDSRKILGWLTDNVPVPDKHQPSDGISVLNQKIEDEIGFCTGPKAFWTPYFTNFPLQRGQVLYGFQKLETRNLYTPFSPVFTPANGRPTTDQKRYFSNELPLVSSQPQKRSSIIPSLLEYNVKNYTEAQEREHEWNTVGLSSGKNPGQWRKDKQASIINRMAEAVRAAAMKKSNTQQSMDDFLKSFASKEDENSFNRAKKFTKEAAKDDHPQETEEQIRLRREKEREDAEQRLAKAEGKLLSVEQSLQVAATEILQLKATLQKEATQTEVLKKQFLELKATIDLVENAVENMAKLESSIAGFKEKLLDWQKQWEVIRSGLITEYRDLKFKFSKREDEITKKREEIKNIRAEIKLLQAQSNMRDEQYKKLLEALKGMSGQEKRATYTNKILALVGTVKKYRTEINTILMDNKNVQKEINVLIDTLRRTFTDVEDLIFKEAKVKKEKSLSDSYKHLARLDEVFKELTDMYLKTGQAKNQSLTLNEKINKLEQRTTSLNMDNINEDLRQVREENQKLQEKYKKLQEKRKK